MDWIKAMFRLLLSWKAANKADKHAAANTALCTNFNKQAIATTNWIPFIFFLDKSAASVFFCKL